MKNAISYIRSLVIAAVIGSILALAIVGFKTLVTEKEPAAAVHRPSTSWSSPQAEADSKKSALEFMDGMRRGMRIGYVVGRSGLPFEPFMEKTEKDWEEIMKKNYPEARP